jgi:hypothetical protein
MAGSVWANLLRCRVCGAEVIQVELSEADDDPLGPPLAFLICDECGGIREVVERC